MASRKDFIHRPLEPAAAARPVMPVAKSLDAMRAGKRRLLGAGFRQAQIVVAQIRRQARLVMPGKERLGLGHDGPLGRPPPP